MRTEDQESFDARIHRIHRAASAGFSGIYRGAGRVRKAVVGGLFVLLLSATQFLPALPAWNMTSEPLNVARFNHTATLLADGRVLVTGGI